MGNNRGEEINYLGRQGFSGKEIAALLTIKDSYDRQKIIFQASHEGDDFSFDPIVFGVNVREKPVERSADYQESQLLPMERYLIKSIKENPITRKTIIKELNNSKSNYYNFEHIDAIERIVINLYEGGVNDGLIYILRQSHDRQTDIVKATPNTIMVIHDSLPTAEGRGKPVTINRSPGLALPAGIFESYHGLLLSGIGANRASLEEQKSK